MKTKTLLSYNFVYVDTIKLEQDANGDIISYNPKDRYLKKIQPV